ncbi:MAG: L-lactate dehydrogenase [Alphaproteobacteria bacterium]|nr:L-lactate dehydrogenase [Alphaproteobacteria bacterium]
MDRIATISDLREAARRKLPLPIFDFVDGAAFSEVTLRANTQDFERVRFRQRVLKDVSVRSLATTIVGQPTSMPAAISPTGLSGMLWGGNGEIAAARAAKAAGIPFTLGMMSVCTLEEVRAAVGPIWFQLCMLKDRGLVRSLVDSAREAECPVLVLTVTWTVSGLQSRSVRNGIDLPPKLSPRMVMDFASRPGWVWRAMRGKRVAFHNFVGRMDGEATIERVIGELDATTSWKDVEWLRSIWPGKLIIKGICDREDARSAMDAGADAVSVSNHGGNHLDSAASTISVLPDVVEGIDGRGEVLLDGGVRSGQDILKAMALGARGCLLGRAHLYGLAAGGEQGVAKALDIIRNELDVSVGLTGLTDVHQASRAILASSPF